MVPETKGTVLEYMNDAIEVTIEVTGDGVILRWNDLLVNEWSEAYPSIAVALMRAGHLLHGAEAGDGNFLSANPTAAGFHQAATAWCDFFNQEAAAFLDSQIAEL